jgi:transposase
MRPRRWQPPEALSPAEETIVKRIRRGRLFVFLRKHRHELLDEAMQEELAGMYKAKAKGQPPVPPAQLALATILQAYVGWSDDEVIEAITTDRRWEMVLDCLDTGRAPFSKGTLVAFRERLIAHDMDRRLVERTVELARSTGGFGATQLRAALDSSPLWGAGRVEDTINLLGHALRKALGMMARQQGWGLADMAEKADLPMLGGTSLKAALDLDWDQPASRTSALSTVLHALTTLETYISDEAVAAADVQECLEAARQVRDQDVVFDAVDGTPTLKQGVAKDRRISIEDAEMRHGRKSRSRRFDGYKRHVLRDLDSALVVAVGVTPANLPEATVTEAIQADLKHAGLDLSELHIDRGYLSSDWIRHRPDDLRVFCKAWTVRNGDRFPKSAFHLDWDRHTLRCPNDVVMPFRPGGIVHFPAESCQSCPLRDQCTRGLGSRSISIHPDERLLAELRTRQQSPEGRADLRQRVDVEHALAHIGQWQGDRARYLGARKNLFDTRRTAVVHNLHVIQRSSSLASAA